MRGCKLRSGVHWQGVLNQKGFNKGYAYLWCPRNRTFSRDQSCQSGIKLWQSLGMITDDFQIIKSFILYWHSWLPKNILPHLVRMRTLDFLFSQSDIFWVRLPVLCFVILLHVYIILHKALDLQSLGGTIPPFAQHVTHPLPC
jgi:hypothetical protein